MTISTTGKRNLENWQRLWKRRNFRNENLNKLNENSYKASQIDSTMKMNTIRDWRQSWGSINSNNNLKIISNHDDNIQDLWDTIKRPSLWICGVEEGTEIQTKGIKTYSIKL